MSKILLVEDEQLLGKIVTESLEVRGFDMRHAVNGKDGLALYEAWQPDLIVVDIMMPEMDGLTLTKHIRAQNKHIPIIFLTARSQTKDVVKGFESGGNDYLKKPFSMDELIVRIKELLKRKELSATQKEGFQVGDFYFDYAKQRLFRNKPVSSEEKEDFSLSYRETELLYHLCNHRNNVLERKQVLLEIWGDDSFFNARSMDVFISKLRRYFEKDPSVQIVNIRGIGYKLIC